MSCAAAASVRKLKKAPLSTVRGTGVPLMPTVVTARKPTILTGNSSVGTWQAASASIGSANPNVAKARVPRRRHADGRGFHIARARRSSSF